MAGAVLASATPRSLRYAHAQYALPPATGGGGSARRRRDRGAAVGLGLGTIASPAIATDRAPARLVCDIDADTAAQLAACIRARDLINTPTEHMGPDEMEAVARDIAQTHGADIDVLVGDDLLTHNFPAIHAVGRASHRAPRLIVLRWGDAAHPHVAIVGKGVCFDTGGLDIKATAGMRNMKKDMGGAAHAIALAELIMARRLPVRITLLVPAVENAIGPNAYRPGEVIATRKGVSVEIDNTDAEGRIVLCDALTYAAEQSPQLILDFATLTGAARIALGPDLPALFNDDALADDCWPRSSLFRPCGGCRCIVRTCAISPAHRRSRQQQRHDHGWLHHRRAVSRTLRAGGTAVGASGCLQLERQRPPRPPRRRRSAGVAQLLRDAEDALSAERGPGRAASACVASPAGHTSLHSTRLRISMKTTFPPSRFIAAVALVAACSRSPPARSRAQTCDAASAGPRPSPPGGAARRAGDGRFAVGVVRTHRGAGWVSLTAQRSRRKNPAAGA